MRVPLHACDWWGGGILHKRYDIYLSLGPKRCLPQYLAFEIGGEVGARRVCPVRLVVHVTDVAFVRRVKVARDGGDGAGEHDAPHSPRRPTRLRARLLLSSASVS